MDSTQPTRVRYGVMFVIMTMAMILYLHRNCLGIAALDIQPEFELDKKQMGYALGAFFFSYALGQLPGGWLGDRLGARITLTVCVVAWSVVTGLTALTTGLMGLIAVRLGLGIFQAGAFPVAARVFSQWVPFPLRGFANSLVTLGGRSGGAVAPWLTAYLILHLAGWRPVFIAFAVVGVIWAVLFWIWFRNTPTTHPLCNQAENQLIEESRPPSVTDPNQQVRGVPWRVMLTHRDLWFQCILQFIGNIPWTLLVTWLPTFLTEVYKVDKTRAGYLSGLPLWAGMAGCFLGGIVTDALTRRVGLRWGRGLLGIVSKFFAAAGVGACIFAGNETLAIAALCFSSFAMDTGLAATWAYFQDTSGPYVGTFLGWANMFGNLGSALCPILLGDLVERYNWNVALGVCAVLYVISGLCWFWVDARKPIVQKSSKF